MTDEQVRAKLLAIFKRMGPSAMAVHCGGRGFAVGCPVCGRRWPS